MLTINRSFGWDQGKSGIRLIAGIGYISASASMDYDNIYYVTFVDGGGDTQSFGEPYADENFSGGISTLGIEARLGSPRLSFLISYHFMSSPFQGSRFFPKIGILLPI